MKRRIYYPKTGEQVATDQVACLFHPNTQAITKKTVKENRPDGLTLQYGLCWQCEGNFQLDHDKKFAMEIDKMLCKRLEDYEKQKRGSQ